MPTKFERLAERIRTELGLDLIEFRRSYAGIHMKGSGAPTWRARFRESAAEVNSDQPASELLQCQTLEWIDGWSPGITAIRGTGHRDKSESANPPTGGGVDTV